MSYGFRVYKRNTIPAGASQAASYSEIAAGGGYQWARQARDAAAKVVQQTYDNAGPDHATGYPFEVFQE